MSKAKKKKLATLLSLLQDHYDRLDVLLSDFQQTVNQFKTVIENGKREK
jgi:hypothetical protein